jgi:serine/threonine protein kinase
MIHCDIACRNLLIHRGCDRFECYVSDFGLSRFEKDGPGLNTSVPIRSSAPEVVRNHAFSFHSDVWYALTNIQLPRLMHCTRLRSYAFVCLGHSGVPCSKLSWATTTITIIIHASATSAPNTSWLQSRLAWHHHSRKSRFILCNQCG